MNARMVEALGQEALLTVLALSAAPVLAALVVGLVVSLLQAATQIQEQSVAIVPKIVAVYVIVLLFGMTMLEVLRRLAFDVLGRIAEIGR